MMRLAAISISDTQSARPEKIDIGVGAGTVARMVAEAVVESPRARSVSTCRGEGSEWGGFFFRLALPIIRTPVSWPAHALNDPCPHLALNAVTTLLITGGRRRYYLHRFLRTEAPTRREASFFTNLSRARRRRPGRERVRRRWAG